jgi:hypothetical protein
MSQIHYLIFESRFYFNLRFINKRFKDLFKLLENIFRDYLCFLSS